MAFHQQAADELGGNLLGGAAKEGVGEGLVAMGVASVRKCLGLLKDGRY